MEANKTKAQSALERTTFPSVEQRTKELSRAMEWARTVEPESILLDYLELAGLRELVVLGNKREQVARAYLRYMGLLQEHNPAEHSAELKRVQTLEARFAPLWPVIRPVVQALSQCA